MKSAFSLSLCTLVLAFFSSAVEAADLNVSQSFDTPYYAEGLTRVFSDAIFTFMDQELRTHRCLQGKTSGVFKKKAKTQIFSNDIPGVFSLTYQTECVGTDLLSVRFAADSFGYDEDYTWVVLELTTASGVTYSKMCISPFTGGLAAAKFCWNRNFKVPAKFSQPVPTR